MFGRRYRLLVGKAYAIQESFVADVPNITPERLVGYRYKGTLEGAPLLEQGGFGERYLPDISKEAVYKKRTIEEFQQIQSAIMAGFIDADLERYVNMYYTDPSVFEESAGFLQFQNIEISDHHIEFDIEKIGGNSSDGNSGEITIYNLSEEDAAFIASLAATQNFARLDAGYSDEGLVTLIKGNVKVVEDRVDGLERRTKLEINDGGNFVQNQMSSRTYRKGTRVSRIIADVMQDVALPKGFIELPDDSVTIKKPLIVHGRSVEQLKRVLDVFGYSVNIQDMYINIYKRALDEEIQQAISQQAEAVDADTTSITITSPAGYVMNVRLVSETSGMISIPTLISDTSGMSTQEIANEPTSGIKFKHLLAGDLSPNSVVRLETETFSGNFRIIKTKHSGSYEGDRWETEVEAERLSWKPKNSEEGTDKEDGTPVTWEEERKRRLQQIPTFEDTDDMTESEWEAERRRRLQQIPTFQTEFPE